MNNRVINNRYELLKEVGKGGSSIVYLAADLTLNKTWAVKEIKKNSVLVDNQRVTNELLTEVNLMKNLNHANLPRIVDIIEEQDRYYIVMDYVEGETLKSMIEKYGCQEQKQVILWGIELASVLGYLHKQSPAIIYRDMKPANIILQPNGELKLIDFGIARTYKDDKSEDTMPLGTKGYAAPEQFVSSKIGQSDERTDIYNLGVTLYELLTCHRPTEPPYELYPLRDINPTFSIGLDKIIHKCTQQNPENRFQSTDELIEALLNYEKLDNEYMREQKGKLKKATVPFFVGTIAIILSLLLFIVNSFITSNKYEKLISEGSEKNLKKAITVDYGEITAYELLMEKYKEDNEISESEVETLMEIYNEYVNKLSKKSKEFLDINFLYGENLLTSFKGDTDDSLRNKIVMATPFFEAVVNSGKEDYEQYKLSEACVDLGSFYKSYVLDDSILKEAKKKDYEQLFSDFERRLDISQSNQMKLISYELMLNIIDQERYNISLCLEKERLLTIIEKIKKETEHIKTTKYTANKSKEDLIKSCDLITDKVIETYNNKSKIQSEEDEI